MQNTKITNADLNGKGVIGLPDAPGLSAHNMQAKFDEIALQVLVPKHNELINELASANGANYIGAGTGTVAGHIANKANPHSVTAAQVGAYTKDQTDSKISERIDIIGSSDMTRAVYDTNNNGIVDNSERLGGELPSRYAKTSDAFSLYTHTKNGTTHELSGTGDNIKFVATASFAGGDKFTVNGVGHTATTTDGESLLDHYFVSGTAVGCFKSGNTLNFKTGGTGLNYKVAVVASESLLPTAKSSNTMTIVSSIPLPSAEPKMMIHPMLPNVSWTGTSYQYGQIWIATNSSDGSFQINSLKGKRYLYIWPIAAYQWDGSNWKKRNAWIDRTNTWEQFSNIELSIFDGSAFYNVGTIQQKFVTGNTGAAPWSIANGYVTMGSQTQSGVAGGSQGRYGSTMINLTDYSTLTLRVAGVSGTPATDESRVGFISSNASGQHTPVANNRNTFTNWVTWRSITTIGEKYLDISGLSGSYYFAMQTGTDSTTQTSMSLNYIYLS